MFSVSRLFAVLATVLVLPWAATLHAAETLEAPSGPVVLTVSGAISVTNVGDTAQFDLELLQDLPGSEITTSTIWTEGTITFTGIPLSALLDRVGATGAVIKAAAINDYTIEIPMDSVEAGAPLVAYKMNGDIMSRRDKGPLWIVYPFDADAKYRSEVVYSRSIWQLDRITISE